MGDGVCWRSECQRGCYYPDVCSETTATPDAGGDWRDVPHVHAGTDCAGGPDCPARADTRVRLTDAEAMAGEVWQEADNVLLLCIEPGVRWRDFRGADVPWDAPLIARPLRRLLDADGNLDPARASTAQAEAGERYRRLIPEPDNHHNAAECPYCRPRLAQDGAGEVERLRAQVAAVKALLDDPWHGDARWDAVHHTGVSRRGALRGGDFVAVDDLRAALDPKTQPHNHHENGEQE